MQAAAAAAGLLLLLLLCSQGALTVGDTVLFLTLMAQLYGPLSESATDSSVCVSSAKAFASVAA
jgi:hypothetical protein